MKMISAEHGEVILTEMCKRVGVDYKTFDFKQNSWYSKHSWTKEEEESFRVWLGKFLVKYKYVTSGNYRGQNHGYYEAGKLIMNYGWKTALKGTDGVWGDARFKPLVVVHRNGRKKDL